VTGWKFVLDRERVRLYLCILQGDSDYQLWGTFTYRSDIQFQLKSLSLKLSYLVK